MFLAFVDRLPKVAQRRLGGLARATSCTAWQLYILNQAGRIASAFRASFPLLLSLAAEVPHAMGLAGPPRGHRDDDRGFFAQNRENETLKFFNHSITAPMYLFFVAVYLLSMWTGGTVVGFVKRAYQQATEHNQKQASQPR